MQTAKLLYPNIHNVVTLTTSLVVYGTMWNESCINRPWPLFESLRNIEYIYIYIHIRKDRTKFLCEKRTKVGERSADWHLGLFQACMFVSEKHPQVKLYNLIFGFNSLKCNIHFKIRW